MRKYDINDLTGTMSPLEIHNVAANLEFIENAREMRTSCSTPQERRTAAATIIAFFALYRLTNSLVISGIGSLITLITFIKIGDR